MDTLESLTHDAPLDQEEVSWQAFIIRSILFGSEGAAAAASSPKGQQPGQQVALNAPDGTGGPPSGAARNHEVKPMANILQGAPIQSSAKGAHASTMGTSEAAASRLAAPAEKTPLGNISIVRLIKALLPLCTHAQKLELQEAYNATKEKKADGSNDCSRLISGIQKVVGRDKLVACIRSLAAPDVITGLQ
eukprot:CAMPEP_0198207204 /NCGR_PEP_ID=MMETSP1445-20131203/10686_1 /TAXON_ID=36898 /ORGANISM="Pyramimonas sp., Strain CCMP2087" /LENGTH=190 /DNA_ID=CAMNT_0043880167 /DNA_START=209 /DNA_END=778 /DNA_ORIENTATION=+